MKYAKIAIFSDKRITADGYAALLGQYAASISIFELEQDGELSSEFDLIIIDFSSKKYRFAINRLIENRAQHHLISLISPYTPTQIDSLIINPDRLELILTKPFLIDRLETFVKNQTNIINQRQILEAKTSILSEVVQLNPNRIAVFTPAGILYYANNHYLSANAIDLAQIDTLHFNQISHCQIGWNNILDRLSGTDTFIQQRLEENRWYESYFYTLSHNHIVHICKDITIEKQNEMRLEQAGIFFEQSNEALVITDKNGIIVSVNAAFCRITGYTKNEAIGQSTKLLNSGIHDRHFYESLWNSLIHNNAWQGEIWNKRKNGEIYPEWLSISKAFSAKYNEEFFIALFTDITSIKETDRKLYFYANHDPLTGLANRAQFESQLKKQLAFAKRRHSKIALLFIDLDKFKEVNDTFGHSVGDMMLKTITKRLSDVIRAEDFLSRLGGDEFVIIAGGAENTEGVLVLAQKLIDTIKDPIVIEGKIFFMTLSIGISIYPDHGEISEDLIKNADSAMYEVKENGRNGYIMYQNSFSEKLSLKVQTQSDLKSAIEKDEFELFYQPIIDMNSHNITGAEALIRWHHPQKGLLYPASFISYVENSDLIYDFGMMVCAKAFADLAILNQTCTQMNKFRLSINIATKQFFEDDFVLKLTSLMNDFVIDPTQIELEILETQIMQNPEIAQKKFNELHALGIKLALDDFGTGYSSLSYLKNFTIDKLKIDQSFVRDLLEDTNDQAIVQTIITMSKIFNMEVQAEGVETLEHENALMEMGCDFSQGYLYTKPIPLREFVEWAQTYKKCHGS